MRWFFVVNDIPNGYFYFRIFGYGLHFKNVAKNGLTFSERNGYAKRMQIGDWSIKVLKPNVSKQKEIRLDDDIINTLAQARIMKIISDDKEVGYRIVHGTGKVCDNPFNDESPEK